MGETLARVGTIQNERYGALDDEVAAKIASAILVDIGVT